MQSYVCAKMRMLVFTAIALCGVASAGQGQDVSEAQMKRLALEAILENPEIIVQALELLEQRNTANRSKVSLAVQDAIIADPEAQVFGNPNGDITLIEFFDYNCGFCRKTMPELKKLLAQDGNLRVVMREWPVLGPDSQIAARLALAARAQGKYEPFHWALMQSQGRVTQDSALKIASSIGLDTDKLLADMNSSSVEKHLSQSSQYAQTLDIRGTPAMLVKNEIIPGYVSYDQLESIIAQQRAAH